MSPTRVQRMKKPKVDPANLSEAQRAALKDALLAHAPQLAPFQDAIEYLVERYSQDKNFVTRLMKTAEERKTSGEEGEPGSLRIMGHDEAPSDIVHPCSSTPSTPECDPSPSPQPCPALQAASTLPTQTP